MRLFKHLHFEEGSDDWFFEPVIARFFDRETPFAMAEHSMGDGEWELEGLLRAFPEAVVLRRGDAVDGNKGTFSINRLVLKLEADCFIVWDAPRMYILAAKSERSRALMDELMKDFFKPKRHRNKAVFNVICQQYGETASTSAPVKRPFLRKAEDFALHYGEPFTVFHESLVARMKRLRQGVAVLRGEPGTGKTTYIRALMWQLRRTHRFYTIPLQEFTRMTASDLTSFWLDEKKEHAKQTIVMVIEDAEDLIRGDGHERPPQIATLLNLSDGLIGE
ncbi:MAG: AAA family ATPase, partial [Verrucomicrobia bacterium]|nr:AAA family ATPase [Verrucomicrobiota bacterium]